MYFRVNRLSSEPRNSSIKVPYNLLPPITGCQGAPPTVWRLCCQHLYNSSKVQNSKVPPAGLDEGARNHRRLDVLRVFSATQDFEVTDAVRLDLPPIFKSFSSIGYLGGVLKGLECIVSGGRRNC